MPAPSVRSPRTSSPTPAASRPHRRVGACYLPSVPTPKRSLSQNFLSDPCILGRVAVLTMTSKLALTTLLFCLGGVISPLRAQQTPPPPPPRYLHEQLSPEAERQGDIMRIEAMRLAGQKGYRPGRYVSPHLAMFESMGPSPVIPFTAQPTEPVQLKRNCTAGQRASIPNCIRIDALELFTMMDTTSHQVILSVVPHTFIGPDQAGMYEVAAQSDVQGDAEVIARRYSGRVVTAIPFPVPQQTPPSP